MYTLVQQSHFPECNNSENYYLHSSHTQRPIQDRSPTVANATSHPSRLGEQIFVSLRTIAI